MFKPKKFMKEGAEPKKEEAKEAKMPAFMRKRVEAKEGHKKFAAGGMVTRGNGCATKGKKATGPNG